MTRESIRRHIQEAHEDADRFWQEDRFWLSRLRRRDAAHLTAWLEDTHARMPHLWELGQKGQEEVL